jgi:hypothetical protein
MAIAIFLRRGLLSFAVLLPMMLPSTEVNEGRDQADGRRGPLKFDFSDPCNAILMAMH